MSRWGRGGRGVDSAQRVGWQEAGVVEAPEKQVGEAVTCPGSRDCLLPPPTRPSTWDDDLSM